MGEAPCAVVPGTLGTPFRDLTCSARPQVFVGLEDGTVMILTITSDFSGLRELQSFLLHEDRITAMRKMDSHTHLPFQLRTEPRNLPDTL